MSGDGWQAIAAPSGKHWLRVERLPLGCFVVVEIESPAHGSDRIAVYGPLPAGWKALVVLADLRDALAAAPGGNVAGVLATFGLPGLPGMISTATAAEAVRKAREGRKEET